MASLSPLMEEILADGGTVELTVTGVSMQPMLLHRVSRVRLAPVGELGRGDIPLYRRNNGQFLLHRIVQTGETYTCCGDNQWQMEKGLRKDQMLAVVTAFSRRGDGQWTSCGNHVYRLYWNIWLAILPLRSLAARAFRRLKRMFSKQ